MCNVNVDMGTSKSISICFLWCSVTYLHFLMFYLCSLDFFELCFNLLHYNSSLRNRYFLTTFKFSSCFFKFPHLVLSWTFHSNFVFNFRSYWSSLNFGVIISTTGDKQFFYPSLNETAMIFSLNYDSVYDIKKNTTNVFLNEMEQHYLVLFHDINSL